MRWFLPLIISASAVWAQFPLPIPTRPASFPLQRPSNTYEFVSAWGFGIGQAPSITAAVQVSAGIRHALALRQDGGIVGWGADWHGQTTVSPTIGNVVQVSAGSDYSVALRSDGTAVLWGMTQWSGLTSWQSPIQPSGFTNLVQVSSSHWHTVGLRSDGSVVMHGGSYGGNLNIPQGLSGVVQVAAGFYHCLALRENGTVVAWGGQNIQSGYSFSRLNYGQAEVPSDLANVVQVAAGEYHSAALKSDGTVVVWGSNEWGQRDVPPGLSGVVSIASGARHVVAVKSDGSVVSWGDVSSNLTPPSTLQSVVQASAGQGYTVVLAETRSPRLVVEFPLGAPISTAAASANLPATIVSNSSVARIYTLKNAGTASLANIAATTLGPNSSQFLLTPPATNALAPGETTTFSVSFAPTSSGSHAAQISITSNDTNNTPFIVNLSGFGLSDNVDTDGDGLSDAWEAGLGRYQIVNGAFTWEQAQADARSKGGHLATFTSTAEWDAFLQMYGSDVLSETRIGMETSNGSVSGYRWVTDEAGMFFNWAPEQPNGSFETTVVLYSYATGCVWHDFSTSNPFPYVLEFGYPTDPFNADTDGDGYADKIESDNGSDPNNAAATPSLIDRDNDGVNYYREIADGTDPTNATSFNPLSRGLVAFYPFNGSADDESGFSNHGLVVGAILTNSMFDTATNAYFFSDAMIDFGNSITQELTNDFSISVWVNLKPNDSTRIPRSPWDPIVVKRDDFSSMDWQFYFDRASQTLKFDVGANSAQRVFTTSLDLIGGWNMLTVTKSGAVWSLYHNGDLADSASLDIEIPTGDHLLAGAFQAQADAMDYYGSMDNIRLYNRALTQSELEILFYNEAFTMRQKHFLTNNPAVMGHFSQAEYSANRTNGQTDVTTNPSAFNLFTQSQFDANYSGGVTAGISSVLSNPASYNLYTSNSIMDLRMGGLMIQKQNNQAVVVFRIQTTTNLATQPFTNYGTPLTNLIVMPERSGFVRITGGGAVYVGDPNQVPPTIEPDPTPTPTPSAP